MIWFKYRCGQFTTALIRYKFHMRQGNCFILQLKLGSPSKFYLSWFCNRKLLLTFNVFVFSESVETFPHRIMTNTPKYFTATAARAELSTCHHYCALTNYTSSIVMRERVYTSFESLSWKIIRLGMSLNSLIQSQA